MARSKIEWLAQPGTKPESWNPVTGCTEISAACSNCYASRMAKRLQRMGQRKYRNAFEPTFHPEELVRPYRWRKPRTVFVCSMSDLFHDAFTDEQVDSVLNVVCAGATWPHTFMLLTKRPKRMVELTTDWGEMSPNVWCGVTVEHPDHLRRIDHLRQVPAAVRFVSFEPLLGAVQEWEHAYETGRLNFDGIDWAIVGAETGPGRRKMDEQAALAIGKWTTADLRIPFFFKKNNDGSRILRGANGQERMYEEWPT